MKPSRTFIVVVLPARSGRGAEDFAGADFEVESLQRNP